NNYLSGGTGSWTISFLSNAAIITDVSNLSSTPRNILRYNSASSLFSCYASGQAPVFLFRICYPIVYNGNGNTGGVVPTDPNSPYFSGSTVTVRSNTGSLVKTGYTFSGWNTLADGTGTTYAATGSATLTMPSANVTLFAQWVPSCTSQTVGAITPASISKSYGDVPYNVFTTSSSGLTVSYSSSNTGVATVDASGNVTIVGAGTSIITASQGGNATYCAATNVTQSLTVSPKTLTVTGATASNKIYDRTVSATITGATANGLVNGDVITVAGSGTFNDASVGQAKPVTANLTLSGTHASSYTLTQPTGLTANITRKTITLSNASVATKEYDGTANATLTATLNGVISPDEVLLNPSAGFTTTRSSRKR
ncbi:MAG: hypothetical protein EOP49_48170, partial [Sphingobacteriales bacterium]